MAYLFDTDAISETLKPRPAALYVRWLRSIVREEQYTSAVVAGELFKGAYRSAASAKWLRRIEGVVLTAVTVLPYDVNVARIYGQIRAELELKGTLPGEADLQIAATALYHDLELVTGNLRHFERVPGLRINAVLADARRADRTS
jgi:predicted nucleic acid-binding protein